MTRLWKKRIVIYLTGSNKKWKPGKFVDELADDAKKYFGEDYEKNIDKSFPMISTGYCVRIVECFNPQSKSGANMFIAPSICWKDGRKTTAWDYPRPDQQDWLVGYKCFTKGVVKNSCLTIRKYGDEEMEKCERIKEVKEDGVVYYRIEDGIRHDRSTFVFLRYSLVVVCIYLLQGMELL